MSVHKSIVLFCKKISVSLFKLRNPLVSIVNGQEVFIYKSKVLLKSRGGNKIRIGNGVSIRNTTFLFAGSNNQVVIEDNVKILGATFWIEDNDNLISVGAGNTMENNIHLAAVEGTSICIGSDCMLSHDINIRTTDSHSIVNLKGDRINPSQNVNIGNHVWIGLGSVVLKGSWVPDNSIVGARSVFTASKAIFSNCIYAGVPAKKVQDNINWTRERIKEKKI